MTTKELNKSVKAYESATRKIAVIESYLASCEERLNDPRTDEDYARYLKSSIKSENKKLEKVKAEIETMPLAEITAEITARNEMVNNFADLIEDLTDYWTAWRKSIFMQEQKEKEVRNEKRRTMTASEIRNLYGYRFGIREEKIYEWTAEREAEARKESREEAIGFVYDLRFRVMDYIGCITDYSELRIGKKSLEGTVKGTQGTAEVNSIWAGGYNIQKLHVRVLVKKVN